MSAEANIGMSKATPTSSPCDIWQPGIGRGLFWCNTCGKWFEDRAKPPCGEKAKPEIKACTPNKPEC